MSFPQFWEAAPVFSAPLIERLAGVFRLVIAMWRRKPGGDMAERDYVRSCIEVRSVRSPRRSDRMGCAVRKMSTERLFQPRRRAIRRGADLRNARLKCQMSVEDSSSSRCGRAGVAIATERRSREN